MGVREKFRAATVVRTGAVALVLTSLGTPAVATPSVTPAPAAFRAIAAEHDRVSLRWRAVRGARRYRVLRDGRVIAHTAHTHFHDRSVRSASSYTYHVEAAPERSRRAARSIPAPVTTVSGAPCNRYVTAWGSDTGDGSPARPWLSVQRMADALRPGEVGCIAGTRPGDVTIRRGGAPGAPIVLRSPPGLRGGIRGRLWIADSADHVVVQGLQLDGRNLDGGDLPSPTIQGDDVLLLRNDITNGRWAICVILGSIRGYGRAEDVVLDGNRIHDCGRRPANNHHHGVYLEHAYRTRITNNVILGSADRGIQLYPNAQNSYIARNVLHGNGEGIIFSGNHGYASSGNVVVDNVIVNSRLRYNIEEWWPVGNPVGRRNVATRNCLWGGHDGNVSERPRGFRPARNRVANPRFRNVRSGDLRPGRHSGCAGLLMGYAPLSMPN